MKYTVLFTEYSKVDYIGLEGSQKRHVLKSLAKIEKNGMSAGQPLLGKHWDCRKLKHKKVGLRVIFRQIGTRIEIIEIIAIGKREDDKVYEISAERLGRN